MSDKSQEAADQAPEPIMAASGSSFKTREAAQGSMKQRGFTFSTHKIEQYEDGGFVIIPLPSQPKEKYFIVKFGARSSKQDTEDVQLFVNGEVLIMQREKEVIVPERFLECADHATYNQWRAAPGHSHKIAATIKTYPYERVREVSKAEYQKSKAEGTRVLKHNIKKYGFDATPDDIGD